MVGMLFLLIGAAYLVLRFETSLTIRVVAVGIGAFIAPYIATVVTGGIMVAQPRM